MNYLDDIRRFTPLCEQEEADRPLMLAAALRDPRGILTRDSALMHMTASSMIVSPDRARVLMAYHNIYRSWAWTGGHADGESDMLSVALREAREETGIAHLKALSERPVSLEILHVPPHVKRGRFVSAHLHFNLTYALEGDADDEIRSKPDENARVGWLPMDGLDEYVSEKEMLVIYRKILSRIAPAVR